MRQPKLLTVAHVEERRFSAAKKFPQKSGLEAPALLHKLGTRSQELRAKS
jgi:hypothetical protein